jgi:antitoxin VapB
VPRAKVFRNGRSQAIRLPKKFRFSGDEVEIRQEGRKVILEPARRRAWPKGYWKSWGKVPDDFEAPKPLPSPPPQVDLEE